MPPIGLSMNLDNELWAFFKTYSPILPLTALADLVFSLWTPKKADNRAYKNWEMITCSQIRHGQWDIDLVTRATLTGRDLTLYDF
jgi:hypothetical protein